MPQQPIAFVLTDGSAKIGSSERRFIRSYCMQKKNKKPDSRRSKREAARAAARCSQDAEGHQQVDSRLQPTSAQDRAAPRRPQFPAGACMAPLPPPSDWALFQFPEELDPFSQELMHQYFIRNPIRDLLYPFKLFGFRVDFDHDPFWCFRLLSSEPLCFRAILLLTSASKDLMMRHPLSNTTRRHLRCTLPILNERLSDTDAYQNDITLYVISILAAIAVHFGDYKAAGIHATALSEIIRLRGGFEAINPLIELSINRLNFSSLLVTDLWIPICKTFVWKIPVFPAKVTNLHHLDDMLCVDRLIEPQIALVFRTLQHITILFDMHFFDKTPIDGRLIRESLGFVHSNLTELEGRLQSKLSECLRLGMMAFLATTFRLPDLYEQHYCKNLANKLRLSYAAASASHVCMPEAIDMWLTFVYLISESPIVAPCSQPEEKARKLTGLSWSQTRGYLRKVMWSYAFHDDLGRAAFAALTSRQTV